MTDFEGLDFLGLEITPGVPVLVDCTARGEALARTPVVGHGGGNWRPAPAASAPFSPQGAQGAYPVYIPTPIVVSAGPWDGLAHLTALLDEDEDGKKSDVLGELDIAPLVRQFNTIKMPTIAMARVMLARAQATINDARSKGANLPGVASRDIAYWKLDYYAKKLAAATDPTAPLGPEWPDFRKWVLQAYIEADAVDVARAYAKTNWDAMWNEIAEQILALPQTVRNAVVNTTAGILGIPPWALYAVGGTVVAGACVLLYKVVTAAAPVVAKEAARRYLP